MASSTTTIVDGKLLLDSVKVGGTNLGYTNGGVRVVMTEDRQKMYVDQLRTAAKEKRREVECTVELAFAQLQIDTLILALGQAAANAAGSTALHADDTEPSATNLEFVVEMDDAPDMKWYFHNVQITSGGGFELRRGEQVDLPVTFKAYLDTATNTKFFYAYHGVGIS